MARIGGAFPLPLSQVAGRRQQESNWLPAGCSICRPANTLCQNDASCQIDVLGRPIAILGYLHCDSSTGGYVQRMASIFASTIITALFREYSQRPVRGRTNGIGPVINGVSVACAASDTTGYPTVDSATTIIGGSVAAPTVTQAGSGFTRAAAIVIDPPPAGGIQATAYCGDAAAARPVLPRSIWRTPAPAMRPARISGSFRSRPPIRAGRPVGCRGCHAGSGPGLSEQCAAGQPKHVGYWRAAHVYRADWLGYVDRAPHD